MGPEDVGEVRKILDNIPRLLDFRLCVLSVARAPPYPVKEISKGYGFQRV